ncbi:unnamed protein product [Blepharisma stoltei]|uniref:F-box domain-containing protein n=1 Tax=Blepharisma stoltei TaxID=1481888 RepID=A0AAU9JHN2_9CILI|nr:unnamed protein product [Blepharisma stoltei]
MKKGQDLHQLLENQCNLTDLFRRELELKNFELRKAYHNIQLLKGILVTIKQDLNLKPEQFEYLFGHIFKEEEECENRIANQKEIFRENLQNVTHSQNSFQFWPKLPGDVMNLVIEFLEFKELATLACVNKELNAICKNNMLWKKLYIGRWNREIEDENNYIEKYAEKYRGEMKWYHERPVVSTLKWHSGSVTCIDYIHGSNLFVSGSDDSSAMLWQINEPHPQESGIFQQHHLQTQAVSKLISFYGHGGPIWCCLQIPNFKLATGSYDRTVKLWNMHTGKCESTLRGHLEWISCLDANEQLLCSGSWDASIKVWDLETEANVQTLFNDVGNAISCIQLQNNEIIAGCRRNTINLWEIDTGSLIGNLVGHTQAVNAVKRSNFSVLSGSADNTVKQWDLRSLECVNTLKGHLSHVMCLDYDDDAKRVASGSYDKSIRIWDLRKTSEPRQILKGHSAAVFCLKFDSSKLISGSSDQTVKIWNFSDI